MTFYRNLLKIEQIHHFPSLLESESRTEALLTLETDELKSQNANYPVVI